MTQVLKRQRLFRHLKGPIGQFSGLLPSLAYFQAHSSLRPLHKPASDHPYVGLRKQRDEPCDVLSKPPIAHFDVTELAHAEVPLITNLNLVHLGVTLTGLVFGGAGRSIHGGVYHGIRLEQQAVSGPLGVDDVQNLRAQRVLFEQMTESQDANPVRNALGAADAS